MTTLRLLDNNFIKEKNNYKSMNYLKNKLLINCRKLLKNIKV